MSGTGILVDRLECVLENRKREAALDALNALIGRACAMLSPPPSVGERNEGIPQAVEVALSEPAALRVILTDGDAEEPQTLLGDPPVYDHTQRAIVEMIALHPRESARAPALDAAINAIVAAVAADQTLGGTCDMARAEVPDIGNLDEFGAPQAKTASLPITILYTSDSPAG